jgi:basic membrane protein A
LGLVALFAVLAAACGDDATTTTTSTTTAISTTLTTSPTTTTPALVDFNGDGRVVLAVATDGPRDDGGYYQSLVDSVIALSTEFGYDDPIIVDRIDPANAEAELRNLAEQDVDVIAVGSSVVGEPLPLLIEDYPDIFWYCNCGSGYPTTEGLSISLDRGAELWISGGYASGLLMQRDGGTTAVFLGCCDLSFEKESFAAFVHGLQLVDPAFTATYVPTGSFPFDFNNTLGATEAFNTALDEGVSLVVAFLGGAHEPVVHLANDAGVIVMSTGSSRGCERTDLDYDFEVKYSTGDYFDAVFRDVLAGVDMEGTARAFRVGVDEQVGAEFCDGVSAELVALLSDHNDRIGTGEFDDVIAQIVADAYGS